MLFGNPALKPLADLAKAAVRSPENFNWTFIALFAVVVILYLGELEKKNYKIIPQLLMNVQ